MARRIGKQKIMQGLINSVYDSAIAQAQAQAQAQMQTPAIKSGMTIDQIDQIYNSAIAANNQTTPQTSAQEIPKLEDNSLPSVGNPTIASELERMQKVKAENKPRSESEQRAIDTYLADLQRASVPGYKPDYQAEIERMNTLANDTATNWSEGEINARNDYLARLQNALAEEQRKNAVITNPVVKRSSSQKKTTSELVDEIVEEPKKEQQHFSNTRSANEQRDMERALQGMYHAQEVEQRKANRNNIVANAELLSGKLPEEQLRAKAEQKAQYDNLSDEGKAKVDKLNYKIASLETSKNKPVNYEGRMRKLDSDIDEVYKNDPGVANGSIEQALNPNKKLTKEEEKQFKQQIKDYEQNDVNENAYTLVFDDAHPDGMMVPVYTVDENGNYDPSKELTPEQRQEQQDIYALKGKMSAGDTALHGMGSMIPGVSALQSVLYETDPSFRRMIDNAKTQNPVAYRGGQAAGFTMGAVESALAGGALEGTKFANALDKLGKSGGVGRRILAESLKDLPFDVVTDIIPQLVGDINAGKSGGEIASDALWNFAINQGMNTAIPFLQNFSDVRSAIRGIGKNSANVADDVVDTALNPVEMAAKNADVVDDAVAKQAQAVQNVEEIHDDLPAWLKKQPTRAEINAVDPVDRALADPNVYKTHTPEEIKMMKEYVDSTDPNILKMAEDIKRGKSVEPYTIKQVDDRMANDLRNITGLENSKGRNVLIDEGAFNHRDKKHGKNGSRNQTMSDDRSIARIRYILDNYDEAFYPDPKQVSTGKLSLKNGRPAPKVVFVKKIDGQYYVVYAASDAKKGNDIIVTCHIDSVDSLQKNIDDGTLVRMGHANDSSSLPLTSKTGYDTATSVSNSNNGIETTDSLSNLNINQMDESVNPSNITSNNVNIQGIENETPNRVMPMRATSAKPEEEIISLEVPMEGGKGYVEDGKRRVVTNSAVNANVITPEDIADSVELQDIARYDKHSNDFIYDRATDDIAQNGAQWKKDYVEGRPINSDIDVDRGMILLQDLADQIKRSDNPSALIAERNAILRNMATNGTEAGQFIQAFAKYANTADDALVKATKIDVDNTKRWLSRNKKAAEINNKLAEALKRQGYDGSMDLPKERLGIDAYRNQVRNTLDREFSSISDQFTSSDVDYLANLIEQGATVNDLVDALNMKMATGRFGISQETQDAVNEIFHNMRYYDENSQEFVNGQMEAFRLLAKEIAPKASALEKFDAWRYMAMLGNPKTMLRNLVGNKMFSAVTGLSNNLAAAIEAGTDKAYHGLTGNHIQRTKTFLNPVADKNLIDASKADAFGKRFRQIEGAKYEKSTKNALIQARETFDSKPMQLLEKAVDAGISDTKAVANKYSTSLAGYLKANGYDASVFDLQNEYDAIKRASKTRELTKDEAKRLAELKPTVDALEKARDYALKQAEYATFHEDNKVAQWITKSIRDARNSDSKALNTLGFIGEGVLPFKKTPANILRSGFEYSPLGALKSIRETGKLIYENTGSRKGNLDDIYKKISKLSGKEKEVQKTLASDVIDSWSKTLTGSGLAYLGYYLFDKGILTSSRNDEKYQDQLEGKGNYGININGHHYTLDWAAPGVMPLLLGAEIKKIREDNALLDKEWYESPDRILETVNAILDPMFETSMLSGVKDTFQTAANEVKFNENNSAIGGILGALAGNALTGYATQAIPTLSGQIARTVDPIRRTTDTINENILGTAEKQGRKVMNKIPFLSKLNPEYRDAYGRSQNNSPFEGEGVLPTLGNLAYQMLSPGYYSRENVTDADASARQAYNGLDESGKPIRDSKAFAEWNSTKRINGEKLDPEQMQTFREAKGQANYELRDALAHNEWFNGLSSSERTDTLKSINSLADKIGQYAVAPDSVKVSGDLETYLNNGGGQAGIDAVIKSKYQKAARDEAGVTSNSNVGKMINEAIESGNTEQAQKIVEDTKSLADLGLDKPAPAATYTKAQTVIPNLSTEEFAKQYKVIDADGNQGIKQDEIISYLNKGSYSSSQGMQIWNAYGNSGWKKIPVLEDGTWKLKKK